MRITLKSATDTLYYHQDHLGSTRIVTGPRGVIEESYDYYPFGAQFGGVPSDSVSHKYTGQEYDADTGLYFYNARYYNPVLGRFISPDTVVPGTFDPQALNRYSYARNNPMMYNDPSGHYWWVVPAILAAYSAYQTYENGGHFNDMLKSAAITFAVSSIGSYVGGYVGNYFTSYTGVLVGGAVSGAVTGGLYAAIYHGNIARSMVQGAVGGIIMAGVYVAYNSAVSDSYDQVTQETVEANDSGNPSAVIEDGVGGPPGTCTNCQPTYLGPEDNLCTMDYQDLFEGEVKITSPYGDRLHPKTGQADFHSAIDHAPSPNTGYGTSLTAPSKGDIIFATKTGVGFRPEGWPSNSYLYFHHTQLAPNLMLQPTPITVGAGVPIATLQPVGGYLSAAHSHTVLYSGGYRYNPKWVFP